MFFVGFERPSLNISDIASAAVVANHAQTTQAMTNAMIRQRHAAEQAVALMLDQAITQPTSASAAGGVDITV